MINPDIDEQSIYEEGYDAGARDYGVVTLSPYVGGTREDELWREGYSDARWWKYPRVIWV